MALSRCKSSCAQQIGKGLATREKVAARTVQQVGGRKRTIGSTSEENAGFLEQLPNGGDLTDVRVWGGQCESGIFGSHLAAREGRETAEKAEVVRSADDEAFGRARGPGQDDAGGRRQRGHATGSSGGISPLRPRCTASSRRSMAKGLRM